MSIQNSFLSQAGYGYDTVVAVTQFALNQTMRTFYNNADFQLSKCYYVTDPSSGKPRQMDATSFLQLTNQVDPLNVPSWNGSGTIPADVSTMLNAQCCFAFSFTPGDPSSLGWGAVNYVKLNPAKQNALYYLLCHDIQVAFWNPDNKTWVNVTQTKLNEFNIFATINLQNVLDNSNLPSSVQAAVNDLGNTAVNVQQLIFDLDSAVVDPTSKLPQLDSSCSVFHDLMEQFGQAYFAAYQAYRSPVLGYSLVQTGAATLMPTAMNFYTNALVDANGNVINNPDGDQQNLATLNYLFSVTGNTPPTGKQFNWNWLENNFPGTDTNADVNKYSGAVAINRDAFAKYLHGKLLPYVLENCLQPSISVGSSTMQNEFDVVFTQGSLKPLASGFQAFNPSQVAMGYPDTLLSYIFFGSDKKTGWQAADYLSWQNSFELDVSVSGQTLTISQTFIVNIDTVWNGGHNSSKGTPVNMTYTDAFTIIVDDNGYLNLSKPNSSTHNQPGEMVPTVPPDNIVGSWNGLTGSLTVGNFSELPVVMPKQFVFPGGYAFAFKDATFSESSDLVCHVSYLSEA